MTTEQPLTHEAGRLLARPVDGRLLGGVAAGIARYLDIDVTIVRLLVVAMTLLGGLGLPLYAAGWLLVPDEGTGLSIASDLVAHTRGAGAGS